MLNSNYVLIYYIKLKILSRKPTNLPQNPSTS